MSQSVYLVTLKYDYSTKIALTKILSQLNASRESRGLPQFQARRTSLNNIEAQAGSTHIELAIYDNDVPPQLTICISDSADSECATQLELAILTQNVVKAQPVEIIDWPLNHSQLTPQEFSRYLLLVVREALELQCAGTLDCSRSENVEALFTKHFPIKRVAPKHPKALAKRRKTRRPSADFHKEYVGSILDNLENGPAAAAKSASDVVCAHSSPYRLAVWAVSFIVALIFWPLSLPIMANNFRNGENLRSSSLAVGVAGLFYSLDMSMLYSF